MSSKNIVIGELQCVNVILPPELLSRSSHLAVALVKSNKVHEALWQIKVLQVKNKIFACEHLPLILALQRVHPKLEVKCWAIDCRSTNEAHRIICNQLKLSSLSSLNAIEVPAFESAHPHQSKLMILKAWAELFQVHRTTFHSHKRKFQLPHSLGDESRAASIHLDDVLSGVPKI